VNDVYWTDKAGPNFIYICGEWRCDAPSEGSMYPFMLGAEHGARLFVLEHRFYGDSQPFGDWSMESLRYLSSEQALADLAYFLGDMNRDNITRPTVVIGGSYPGALSAWFKSRYPHLAVAAWSSSGVVQAIPDMWQFDERIYDATLKSGLFCPKMIKETNEFATQQAALRDVNIENLIDPVVAGTDAVTIRSDDFMFYYADIFVTSVQYGNRTTLCNILQPLEGQD
jgi:pimeloyl-ACP methyl ester carboxylesterase